MEVVHLNQKQLAARWCLGSLPEFALIEPRDLATLERWRSIGIGPKFLKLCGRVAYRLVDIEAYEESCLQISTSQSVASQVRNG